MLDFWGTGARLFWFSNCFLGSLFLLGHNSLRFQSRYVMLLFLSQDFLNLFLERWQGRDSERERNIDVQSPASHILPTGYLACKLATQARTFRPGLNPLSHNRRAVFFCFCFFFNIHGSGNYLMIVFIYNSFVQFFSFT